MDNVFTNAATWVARGTGAFLYLLLIIFVVRVLICQIKERSWFGALLAFTGIFCIIFFGLMIVGYVYAKDTGTL